MFALVLRDSMADKSTGPKFKLLARLVRLHMHSGLRGATRLTFLLARRFKSLQQVPIDLPGWNPVYIDLRLGNAHLLLMESPYAGLWRELDEVNVMQSFVRNGDVAFDIGANIGLHSMLLSNLVGPQGSLHAFEPNSELVHALSRTISELGNASLHVVALSDKDDESELFIPSDDSMASLTNWTAATAFVDDGPSRTVTCQQRRLDDLINEGKLPQPDFIKCDVEGAELLVFQGGRGTLDRPDAPIVLFEVNKDASLGFGQGVSEAKDFLAGLELPQYEFFRVQSGGKLTRLQEANSFMNVLAVPRSKIQRWPELVELGEIPVEVLPIGDSNQIERTSRSPVGL
jgi:FkbM family methyltransferase